MARIRSIKPDFWTDGDMIHLSRDARLFYIGTWNFADDNGVLEGCPMSLKAKIFPAEDVDVKKLIDELTKAGKIVHYTDEKGRNFFLIKNFLTHQLIDRPRKTNNPLPSEEQMKTIGNHVKSSIDKIGKDKIGRDSTTLFQSLVEIWNSKMKWKVTVITGSRAKHLGQRIMQQGFVEKFPLICDKILANPFLMGLKNGKDHPNFKADFDWVIGSDTKWVNILEGKYDDQKGKQRWER